MVTESKLAELIEREASVETRFRDALDAPEPYPEGEAPGDVIPTTEDAPVKGFVVAETEGGGWKWIWNVRTYERSKSLAYMLRQKLTQRFEDGAKEYVWNTRQPVDAEGNVIYPWRGSNLCFLHKDHPDREYHDTLGLPTCPKANLASGYQARRHAQNRHKDEWGAIEEERDNARQEREGRMQEATIALAQGRVVEEPVTEEPTVEPDARAHVGILMMDPQPELPAGQCPHCEWVSQGKKKVTRKSSLFQHLKRKHGG